MLSATMKRLAEKRDAAEEVGEDAGFTLIELMVVLLILAILLAIAIPTFLGVTKSANDRAAQSNLNTALTSAESMYQSNGQAYPTTTVLQSSLSSAEPNLTFDTGTVTKQGDVSIATDGSGAVALATQSKSTNNCWYIVSLSATTNSLAGLTGTSAPGSTATGTYYGVAPGSSVGSAGCDAANVNAATTWQKGSFPPSP